MLAGKIWASQAEDSFHLSRGYVHSQQFSSQPQVNDAPVDWRKAFLNMPTLQPASINTGCCMRGYHALLAGGRGTVESLGARSWGVCNGGHGRTQQILGSGGQDGASFDDFNPTKRTVSSAAFQFLIGKARQSSQMAPVGASEIAAIDMGQVPAQRGRQLRLQARGADANPSLQMARASFQNHARLVALSTHGFENMWSVLIEIEKNIASIALAAVRQQIHVKTLTVTCSQKAHYRCTRKISGCPHSFSWSWPACDPVNQANEVEIIRHTRQLLADGMQGEKESAVRHGRENEVEACREAIDFQQIEICRKIVCLSLGVHPTASVSTFRKTDKDSTRQAVAVLTSIQLHSCITGCLKPSSLRYFMM
jgi:hypothetical protein